MFAARDLLPACGEKVPEGRMRGPMEPTNQRSVPIAYIVIAALLLIARIVTSF